MQTITKAKIKRENLMDYIHEDRDLLMGLQDDLSDMLYATGTYTCLLYTSPSPRDQSGSRMPSSA